MNMRLFVGMLNVFHARTTDFSLIENYLLNNGMSSRCILKIAIFSIYNDDEIVYGDPVTEKKAEKFAATRS